MPSLGRLLNVRTLVVSSIFILLCLFLVASRRQWELPKGYQPAPRTGSDESKPKAEYISPKPPSGDPRCDLVSGAENVVVAIKTGATEAAERLPMQMMSSVHCAHNLLFFSDKEQMVGDYHLIDALDRIPQSVLDSNSDFDIYKKQKESSAGQIDQLVKGSLAPGSTDQKAAWVLDKYKFMHMLDKTWAAHPNKDWYVFIEADTYLVWPNLLKFLATRDKTKKLYFGSKSYLAGIPFAHGGSGFMISGPAMRNYAVEHNGTAAAWDVPMKSKCCGDAVVGEAMKNHGIEMENFWPTVNGEKPMTLPFGPTHWCQPVVTMHHVTPSEMAELDTFERRRHDPQIPLTFAELFIDLVHPYVPSALEDWNNKAREDTQPAENITTCRDICSAKPECFQFVFNGQHCALGKSFSIGEKKQPEGDKKWFSEWNKTRIEEWVKQQEPCPSPRFPDPW